MKHYLYPEKQTWKNILKQPVSQASLFLKSSVCDVFKEIEKNGDEAVLEFTHKFDGVKLKDLKVSQAELNNADKFINSKIKDAIHTAKTSIENFHSKQLYKHQKMTSAPGISCWQRAIPIEKVGICLQNGTVPLFSTVMMFGIPAKLAGCKKIVLCVSPNSKGKISPVILYTAKQAGVTDIFKIGGVQAIAAMAYGTESVPQVYKIFGSGNINFSIAKQLVIDLEVAIDMPAGPSELAIIADEHANPAFIAADILSTAEHSDDSQVLFVSSSEAMIDKVSKEINIQIKKTPRRKIAIKALANSRIILLNNDEEIIDLINEYAPEQLIINTKNYSDIAERIINAGTVLMGQFTTESAANYVTGANHMLPVNGSAKVYSGVGIDSFIKKVTFQEIDRAGLETMRNVIETLADAEKLAAHKNATSIRLKK